MAIKETGYDYSVSIHAPVGGATLAVELLSDLLIVSIHAPVGGATGAVRMPLSSRCRFNSRARRGRDP